MTKREEDVPTEPAAPWTWRLSDLIHDDRDYWLMNFKFTNENAIALGEFIAEDYVVFPDSMGIRITLFSGATLWIKDWAPFVVYSIAPGDARVFIDAQQAAEKEESNKHDR